MAARTSLFLLAGMLFGWGSESLAQPITIQASADVWLRESGADRTFENDLISVWSSSGLARTRGEGRAHRSWHAAHSPAAPAGRTTSPWRAT